MFSKEELNLLWLACHASINSLQVTNHNIVGMKGTSELFKANEESIKTMQELSKKISIILKNISQ